MSRLIQSIEAISESLLDHNQSSSGLMHRDSQLLASIQLVGELAQIERAKKEKEKGVSNNLQELPPL